MAVRSIAQAVFEQWGAAPVEIATSAAEESDWLATLGGFRLLAEEKTKLENPDFAEARRRDFDDGRIHSRMAALAPNNRIEGIVHKAAKQIASSGQHIKHDARILWFSAVGADAETKAAQAYATLYGSAKVFDLDNSASLQDCFFFHNAAFYRYREHLDGAVLATANGTQVSLQLCLNPFGAHARALKQSPFAAKFGTAVVDPEERERNGSAMIADTPMKRDDAEAMLEYLRQKYQVPRLLQMPMTMVSAAIAQRIPDEPESSNP